MTSAFRWILILFLAIPGLLVWWIACSRESTPEFPQLQNRSEETMTSNETSATSGPAIPPIDAAAPSSYETATFGLG